MTRKRIYIGLFAVFAVGAVSTAGVTKKKADMADNTICTVILQGEDLRLGFSEMGNDARESTTPFGPTTSTQMASTTGTIDKDTAARGVVIDQATSMALEQHTSMYLCDTGSSELNQQKGTDCTAHHVERPTAVAHASKNELCTSIECMFNNAALMRPNVRTSGTEVARAALGHAENVTSAAFCVQTLTAEVPATGSAAYLRRSVTAASHDWIHAAMQAGSFLLSVNAGA